MKLTIEVVFDKKTETYTLTDDIGNVKSLKCLFVLGYDFHGRDFYMFGGGVPGELANAFGEGLARGLHQDQFRGDKWYTRFYQALLKEMCLRTGIQPRNEITPQEAVEKFEKTCDCKEGECKCSLKKTFH